MLSKRREGGLFPIWRGISSEKAASPSAISLPQIAHQRWSRLGRPAPGMSGPEGETDLSGASERPRSLVGELNGLSESATQNG